MLADCYAMGKGETERGLLTFNFFLVPSARVSDANSGELQFPIAIAIQGAIPCEQRAATDRLRGGNQVGWRCRNCLAPSLSLEERTQSQRQNNRPQPLESDCLSQERTILSEIHPKHRQLFKISFFAYGDLTVKQVHDMPLTIGIHDGKHGNFPAL
jgi:hypothetical protein